MPTTAHTQTASEQWTRAEAILLAVLGGVVFLDALDLSLVQVALPSIGSSLHLAERQLQWIVSAYVLGYGGFLLFGGRSADVLGRRRVLVWGLVALIAASILGALASDGTLLIVARPSRRPEEPVLVLVALLPRTSTRSTARGAALPLERVQRVGDWCSATSLRCYGVRLVGLSWRPPIESSSPPPAGCCRE